MKIYRNPASNTLNGILTDDFKILDRIKIINQELWINCDITIDKNGQRHSGVELVLDLSDLRILAEKYNELLTIEVEKYNTQILELKLDCDKLNNENDLLSREIVKDKLLNIKSDRSLEILYEKSFGNKFNIENDSFDKLACDILINDEDNLNASQAFKIINQIAKRYEKEFDEYVWINISNCKGKFEWLEYMDEFNKYVQDKNSFSDALKKMRFDDVKFSTKYFLRTLYNSFTELKKIKNDD